MTNMRDALDRIESDLGELKRQYDLFFQGIRKTEPQEERKILEWMIKRLGQRKLPNTQDQFRFGALQGRCYSYFNLWTRMVRDLEEGRLERDTRGNLVRMKTAGREPVPPEHLEEVLEQLKDARKECGIVTEEKDLEALRETLKARAAELADRPGARQVEFRVSIEGGKPKVRAGLR